MKIEPYTSSDLYAVVPNFITPKQCQYVMEREIEWEPALIWSNEEGGYVVDETFRKSTTTKMDMVDKEMGYLYDKCAAVNDKHFGYQIRGMEPPRIVKYEIGDFIVSHSDYNKRGDKNGFRKLIGIVVIEKGGPLKIDLGENHITLDLLPGDAVFLPSFVHHYVPTVMTRRKSMVLRLMGEAWK